VTSAQKADIWSEISRLLREYELAQIETAKQAIAASYDSLRQRLQVLALDTATNDPDNEGT